MTKINYELLPRRIFLDTNILQYLQDFGEFIFDHYQENEECLVSPKGKEISKGTPLYQEIEALRFLLLGIDRTNVELAVSGNTFKEVQRKQDSGYTRWFFEMWDYWQTILRSYKDGIASEPDKLKRFDGDTALLGRLSKNDTAIIRDAVSFDCNAILTTDKFRNFREEVNSKYKIMILYPTDLWGLLKPWQALWY